MVFRADLPYYREADIPGPACRRDFDRGSNSMDQFLSLVKLDPVEDCPSAKGIQRSRLDACIIAIDPYPIPSLARKQ